MSLSEESEELLGKVRQALEQVDVQRGRADREAAKADRFQAERDQALLSSKVWREKFEAARAVGLEIQRSLESAQVDGPVFNAGRAEGRADVAAQLRGILDPEDTHHWSLDGVLAEVERLCLALQDAERQREHVMAMVKPFTGRDEGEHDVVATLKRILPELTALRERRWREDVESPRAADHEEIRRLTDVIVSRSEARQARSFIEGERDAALKEATALRRELEIERSRNAELVAAAGVCASSVHLECPTSLSGKHEAQPGTTQCWKCEQPMRLALDALEALTDPKGHIVHGGPDCTGECKAVRASSVHWVEDLARNPGSVRLSRELGARVDETLAKLRISHRKGHGEPDPVEHVAGEDRGMVRWVVVKCCSGCVRETRHFGACQDRDGMSRDPVEVRDEREVVPG